MSLLRLFMGPVCDPTSYSYNSDSCGWGAIAAFVLGTLIILFVALIILTAFTIIARWLFFKKCGEAGWKAIVPVYNELTLLKTANMNWWWIFIIYITSILSGFSSTFSSYVQSADSIFLSMISVLFSLFVLAVSVFAVIAKVGEGYNIMRKFHWHGAFTILFVLFEPIMLLILASSSAVYDNKVKVSPNGIFGPRN